MTAHRSWLVPIAVSSLAAAAVSATGGALTDIGPWYAALNKPAWQPPNWLFGPVWTVLYIMAALSATLAWRASETAAERVRVIALFGLNAVLNVGWSFLFFHLKRPDWALIENGLLWLSVAILIAALWRLSRVASLLLVPYLLWVTFAFVLNAAIVRLN
jgi:benzodiazapine receptor